MNSVGIDLHKRRSHIAAFDERGRKILSRRVDNDPAIFLELLDDDALLFFRVGVAFRRAGGGSPTLGARSRGTSGSTHTPASRSFSSPAPTPVSASARRRVATTHRGTWERAEQATPGR
jgi:hypothetical protein